MNRKTASLRRSDGAEVAPANHGPGPRLRDGRLARSMTLEEAAELLKLDSSVLASLERDDFTALPGTLYVRGYLTSYARLLGIPEQEVVRDYQAYTGEASAPVLSPGRLIEERAAPSDRGLRWFSYGLMIGIVALLGWWGYQSLPRESADSTVIASVDPERQPVEQPTPESSAPPAAEPSMPPRADLTAKPGPVESESDQVEVAVYTALPGEGEPAAAVANSVNSASEVPSEPVMPEAEPPAMLGSVASNPAPPSRLPDLDAGPNPTENMVVEGGHSPDVLELSFSRDCWVEIRDARQERLVYGLAKAGSSRRVEGEAPFQILLGDGGAVEMQLNGETTARRLYDTGEGRPARLSLGEAALETATAP